MSLEVRQALCENPQVKSAILRITFGLKNGHITIGDPNNRFELQTALGEQLTN
jgi:hypothetical protein